MKKQSRKAAFLLCLFLALSACQKEEKKSEEESTEPSLSQMKVMEEETKERTEAPAELPEAQEDGTLAAGENTTMGGAVGTQELIPAQPASSVWPYAALAEHTNPDLTYTDVDPAQIHGDNQAAMAFLAGKMRESFMLSVSRKRQEEDSYEDFVSFFRACAEEAELAYTDYRSQEDILAHCSLLGRPLKPGDIVVWGGDTDQKNMGLFLGDGTILVCEDGKLAEMSMRDLDLATAEEYGLTEWAADIEIPGPDRPDGSGVILAMESVSNELYQIIDGNLKGLTDAISHRLDEVGLTERPVNAYITSYDAESWTNKCQISIEISWAGEMLIAYYYDTKEFKVF